MDKATLLQLEVPENLAEWLVSLETRLEELGQTMVAKAAQPASGPAENQTEHSPGLCSAPECERGCATLRQETFEQAKTYVAGSIETAAHWGGPGSEEALVLLQQTLEEWVAAGKPENSVRESPAEPSLIA